MEEVGFQNASGARIRQVAGSTGKQLSLLQAGVSRTPYPCNTSTGPAADGGAASTDNQPAPIHSSSSSTPPFYTNPSWPLLPQTHLQAAGLVEGEHHAATNDEHVHLVQQRLNHGDLGGHLAATHNGSEGLLGLGHSAIEVVQLLCVGGGVEERGRSGRQGRAGSRREQ